MENENKVSTLRKERVSRGLTLAIVSKAIGVSPVTVQSWEVGRTYPNIDSAFRLSKFYGKPISKLFPELFIANK